MKLALLRRFHVQRAVVSCVSLLAFGAAAASAQTTYRCEVNGNAVYTDKPCADGKAVAPTQDTREQQQRADALDKQRRADDREVSKRIADRSSAEAKERSEIRKQQALADKRAAAARAKEEKAAKKRAKKPASKIKVAKTPKSKAGKAKDNRASSPS